MKKDELFDKLEELDDELIKEAEDYTPQKRQSRRFIFAASAAVFVLLLTAGVLFRSISERRGTISPINETGSGTETASRPSEAVPVKYEAPGRAFTIKAVYPAAVAPGMSLEEYKTGRLSSAWRLDFFGKVEASRPLQQQMVPYYQSLLRSVLTEDGENAVCSPLNTYIAFAMLAEAAGGESREQLLRMLGAENIDALRGNVKTLWEANYADTPSVKSLLANSVWLNQNNAYCSDTLNRLAEVYYASSMSGDMSSPEMTKALQDWIDENTGGLLSEYVRDLSLDQNTILALVSTIYFKASWYDVFREEFTTDGVFHGNKGDTSVRMMHKEASDSLYFGKNFTVARQSLSDSGQMVFILPDEGVDVTSLLSDPEVFDLLTVRADMEEALQQEKRWEECTVRYSVPRFSVSGKTDLKKTLTALGAADILDPEKADFTPLTDLDGVFLSKIEHAARVDIDESGVTGAAYTVEMLFSGYPPERICDFILDRPFLFAVTGLDGSLLFAGIVQNIE